MKKFACLILLPFALVTFTGCITTRNAEVVDPKATKAIFEKKKVAVLPTRSPANFSTDSILAVKKNIDLKLDQAMPTLLPSSAIINTNKTINIVNDSNQIETLDKLVTTYDSTGVYNKKMVGALFSTIKCNYLVISRLKTEKLDIMISKATGASLEVTILNGAGGVEWTGVGDFKRGGIFGFGGASANEISEELVKLAFQNF